MIDLNKPIEAVHPDGRVVPMGSIRKGSSLLYTNSAEGFKVWNLSGESISYACPWAIRNVAEAEPTDPDDWAVEEALKQVPSLAGQEWYHVRRAATPMSVDLVLALARMIQKYEPHLKPKPPVDPDVAAVREILEVFHKRGNLHSTANRLRSGGYDNVPDFLAAVEAFKRVKGGVL